MPDSTRGLGRGAKIARLRKILHRSEIRQNRNVLDRYILWLKLHRDSAGAWALSVFWLSLGVLYAMLQERWSLVRGLYFAVSSLSTAGLQGRDPASRDAPFAAPAPAASAAPRRRDALPDAGIPPDSKAWQFVAVGVWCLCGVPIFATGVGVVCGYQNRPVGAERVLKTSRRFL